MIEKRLNDISVSELADTADIHRATFYSHYVDIYDLYDQIESSTIEELSMIITKNYNEKPFKFYKSLLAYISNNNYLCRMLFGKHGGRSFLEKLNILFEEKCIESWSQEWNIKNTKESQYVVNFYIQGCLAIISRWADSNFNDNPNDVIRLLSDMDNIIENYIRRGPNG